jgi:hypothetical protein
MLRRARWAVWPRRCSIAHGSATWLESPLVRSLMWAFERWILMLVCVEGQLFLRERHHGLGIVAVVQDCKLGQTAKQAPVGREVEQLEQPLVDKAYLCRELLQ